MGSGFFPFSGSAASEYAHKRWSDGTSSSSVPYRKTIAMLIFFN